MNQKEVREIKKRFNPEKDSISRIYGCYVNAAREIVTTLDLSVGLMEQEEAELYFKLLKKTLSGTLGKNLVDIEFSTAQVENSDEHRLLQALRSSHLRDEALRDTLYRRIIESLDFGDDSYVILLASDSYDVPFKGSDDEIFEEGSGEVFDYILCCICPVKDAKSSLRYMADEHNFRGASTGHVLGVPELGFLFPAFDDRGTNIYNALYYSRAVSDIHEDFLSGVFCTEKIPMSAGAQKNTFSGVLCESLGEDCSLEVVRAVHSELRERLQLHKESNDPEIPEIEVEDVDDILKGSGIPEEKVSAFNEACRREFGESAALNPINVMETKKFEMTTPQVKITVDPEYTDLIETKIVDGRTCLVIPVEDGITVNGIEVSASATTIQGIEIMTGREDSKANDLFYTCSLIDYIARKTKNRRKDVVDALGESRIAKIYNLADVYHSDNIDRVSDDFIEEAKISEGNFDSVARTKYALPSHWDIGKVFKRLILGISKEKQIDIIPALFKAYHSFVSDKIEDFNSSFYYDAPQNILNAYLTGVIE